MIKNTNHRLPYRITKNDAKITVECPGYSKQCMLGLFWRTNTYLIKAYDLPRGTGILMAPRFQQKFSPTLGQHVEQICFLCCQRTRQRTR